MYYNQQMYDGGRSIYPNTSYHQYGPGALSASNFPAPVSLNKNQQATEDQSATNDENTPPPIPQRQPSLGYQTSPYLSNGYGGMYGNPFGNYMYGANAMNGMYGMNSSPFGQLEVASQNAFQTAQTFIGAFTSVSMMLESTLFAVQNSVRAITSVADQFGHLRNHMLQSSSAALRALKYYVTKLMVSLRLKKIEKDEARYWMDAVAEGSSARDDVGRYSSMLFFCVLIATPWFIWKLLRSLSSARNTDKSWINGTGSHFVAEVKFSFSAQNNDELSITANTIIRLAPKHQQPNVRGWLLASDGEKQGLIPANYVKILGKNRADKKEKKGNDHPSSKDVSLQDEKKLDDLFKESELNEEKISTTTKID